MAGEVTTNDENLDLGPETLPAEDQNFFQQIISDPQKRLYAIIGAVVLLTVVGFFFFGSQNKNENRGDLVPLVQEIDQGRAFEIVAKLKSVNIEGKVMPGEKPGDYVVQVYENAVESSYLTLARTNLLEDDDYGLFDSTDWAASDYDKRIKLTRAINGDLSRIISRMDGLKSAIVRVNVPEQQIFTEMQASTTATVQVELANDADELTKSQVKSVVNVLRGYVPNLEAEKISIVDTQGRNYATFKDEDESDASDFIDEVERHNKLITKRVQKYLDVVLGADEYEVSVSASLSREKIQENQTTYKEGAVGARSSDKEVLNAGNNPNQVGPGKTNGKNYNSQSVNETLLPSFEQKQVTYLPGRVNSVTVALAVDKSVPAMISLSQLQESVAAIVGPEANINDIKLTVVDLHAKDPSLEPVVAQQAGGMMHSVNNFFHGSTWSVITKIFSIIAIIIGLLLVAIISLNFLSAAANRNYSPEVDPDLANEFDEVLNDSYGEEEYDYGESQALQQQEALLREMMTQQAGGEDSGERQAATSYSQSNEETQENVEFESLLNNFQNVADAKPDLLAKKIQVWLDEDG